MFTYPAPDDAPQAIISLCDVRLNITDTDDAKPMLTDAEITSFLRMAGGSVFLASALALENIANKTSLLLKRIKTLALETDGPATAKDLRAQAQTWRQDHIAGLDEDEDGLFEVAQMDVDVFSRREIYGNAVQRTIYGDGLGNVV